MGGSTQGTVVDLREAEPGALDGHDYVSVAGQPDPAPEAEAVHGHHHRSRTLVDGPERLEAGTVGLHQTLVAIHCLDLPDVHPCTEAPALGCQDDRPDVVATPISVQEISQGVSVGDAQGVHRRIVHDDGRHAVVDRLV